MTWIHRINYPESTGYLRELYDRVKGPAGNIDNVMKVHCLRPHTMEGHSAIYKSAMHHTGNTLPVWLLEAVGVYTSLCNGCDYSVQHHYTGLRRQLSDDARADAIYRALAAGRPEDAFEGGDLAFLRYAAKLTRAPADTTEDNVAAMAKYSRSTKCVPISTIPTDCSTASVSRPTAMSWANPHLKPTT